MTEWRAIDGWVGEYEVSDDGQVRSLPRKRTKGRVLKPGISPKGYRIVTFTRPGVRKSYPVHRLVAEAFVGPLPTGWHTCHIDGDKSNNTASNLRYGTPSENEQEKVALGMNPNANKTHCPQGHEYSEANTRVAKKGGRECRTCHRERKRAYDARLRMARDYRLVT